MISDLPANLNVSRLLRSSKPEWVMLGIDWEAPGVALLASKELAASEIDYRARQYDFKDWADFMRNFRPETTLFVHMKDFVLVAGENYAACIETLLMSWSPDERDDGPAAIGH